MQKNDTGVRSPVYVEHRYLAALRAARRPLVYPSWYEGFGLPVTQATACGFRRRFQSSRWRNRGGAGLLVDPRSAG